MAGVGSAQFNLEAVRQRANELQTSLKEIVSVLQYSPERLPWDSVLKQYANINLQLMTLRESLRGVLRQAVVHPSMVDDPGLFNVLPIQLSTNLLPEQVAGDRLIMSEEERKLLEKGTQKDYWYEATDVQLEDYNRLLDSLTSGGGCLDKQGEARKAMTARSQTIARSVAAMRQGVLPAAAQASAASGSKRARTSQETGGLDPALRQFLTG